MKKDDVFHILRNHIFKGDLFCILCEENENFEKGKLFILSNKNPRFFSLIGENNKKYEKFLNKQLEAKTKITKLQTIQDNEKNSDDLINKVNLKYHNKWGNM